MRKRIIDTAKLLPPFEELVSVEAVESIVLRPEAEKLARRIDNGKNLYIFLGSSGAGRDTIMEECLKLLENTARIRRTTTRKPREYVADQKRMIFITEKAFLRDFKKGEIPFAGRYKANKRLYGVSKGELLKLKKDKKAYCLLEANYSGIPTKIMLPDSKLIVVLPPTAEVLKDRLFSRDKSPEECQRRFESSALEIRALLKDLDKMIRKGFVDMVIINEGFPKEVGERMAKAIRKRQRLIEDYSMLEKSLGECG